MGAENYLTWDCVDPATGGRYTLTVGKPGGKSPHEKRLEAEAELEQERARADAAEQDLTTARAEIAHLTCRDGA